MIAWMRNCAAAARPGTIAVVLAAMLFPFAAFAADLTVFAAASLTNAFEDIGRLYQQKTGTQARFSFASSSTLAKQIESGAPAGVFASADEQWMDYLAQRNLIVPESRKPLVGNSLVLVVPAANRVTVNLKPGFDLAKFLGNERLATGDPAHVPVGKYAQDALTKLGLWGVAEPRLVRADSVRSALTFVERGEVAAGIVYATDAAITDKVRVAGVFPADSHAPITYPVALVAGRDTQEARTFLAFVQRAEATAILRRYGFTVR